MSMQLPPGVDPYLTPAMPNPSGAPPNFENPETRAPGAIAAISILTAVMIIVLAARLYSKIFVVHKFGLEDVFAFLGGVTQLVIGAYSLRLFADGPMGKHMWDTRLSELGPSFTQGKLAGLLGLPIASLFVKDSILLLLLRIFPFRIHKVIAGLIFVGIFLVTVFNIIALALSAAWCHPLPNGGQPPACQQHALKLAFASAGFNMGIDIYIFIIPLQPIWALNMTKRRRMGVVAILATGLGACLCSILALYYRITDTKSMDVTWAETSAQIVGNAELLIGLIVACLPCMPALWAVIISSNGWRSMRSFVSRITSPSRSQVDKSTPSAGIELTPSNKSNQSGKSDGPSYANSRSEVPTNRDHIETRA